MTTTESTRSGVQWQSVLRVVLVLAVLGFSGWYVVDNIRWGALASAMRAARWEWLVLGVSATVGSHLARAARWRRLLPEGSAVSLSAAFNATIIGYFMNDLIPRSGEIVRPVLLARQHRLPVAGVIASVLVERLLDGLTLLLLLFGLLVLESERFDTLFAGRGYSRDAVLTAILVPVGALALVIFLLVATPLGERVVAWLGAPGRSRFVTRLAGIASDFRRGLRLGGMRDTLWVVFWTVTIWGLYVAGLWSGVEGLDLQRYGIGPLQTVVILAITALGITIAPTPGAIGVYHVFCTVALTELYGIPNGWAFAFAVVTHAVQYLTAIVLGGAILLRQHTGVRELMRVGEREPSPEEKGT